MRRARLVLVLFLLGCGGGATNGGDAGPSDLATSTNDLFVDARDLGASGDMAAAARRPFPDTSAGIAILVDQLPHLTTAQQRFAVDHFVGTQKQTLDLSQPLRALKPDFLVLHYHLAIWQSAPGVDFILDGKTWSNDYPTVNSHESWFWHDEGNQRIASVVDKKILMNLADPGFRQYWADSLVEQTMAGDYDAIFFDSASPALLQAEVGNQDPRLAATGAKDTPIKEWGGKTYIQVWEDWIAQLNSSLAAKGIPLIPNTGAFITTWDDTDYGLTAGVFVEGFASPSFAPADWKASTDELLALAAKGRIIILQNYLKSATDVATRKYYLANYLLVRGNHTYLDYFDNGGPLEWYPEWALDTGNAMTTGMKADDLSWNGVYRRDFEKAVVLVNPSASPVAVTFSAALSRIDPQGGGAIPADGSAPGSVQSTRVTSVTLAPRSAELFAK